MNSCTALQHLQLYGSIAPYQAQNRKRNYKVSIAECETKSKQNLISVISSVSSYECNRKFSIKTRGLLTCQGKF